MLYPIIIQPCRKLAEWFGQKRWIDVSKAVEQLRARIPHEFVGEARSYPLG